MIFNPGIKIKMSGSYDQRQQFLAFLLMTHEHN